MAKKYIVELSKDEKAEFVSLTQKGRPGVKKSMKDILDLYADPYQFAFPVICFDEVSYQMVNVSALPLPMRIGRPGCYDYECRQEGTCNLFIFLQPQAGWRHIKSASSLPHQETGVSLYAGTQQLVEHG